VSTTDKPAARGPAQHLHSRHCGPHLRAPSQRAREIGYATHFDEILEIADTPEVGETVTDKPTGREVCTGDMIEHRRLRIDARKWMLARALPKVYGDLLAAELTGKDGAPLQPMGDIRDLARGRGVHLRQGDAGDGRERGLNRPRRPSAGKEKGPLGYPEGYPRANESQ